MEKFNNILRYKINAKCIVVKICSKRFKNKFIYKIADTKALQDTLITYI